MSSLRLSGESAELVRLVVNLAARRVRADLIAMLADPNTTPDQWTEAAVLLVQCVPPVPKRNPND